MPFGPAQYLFYMQGLWNPAADPDGMELDDAVENGDESILVNGLLDGSPAAIKTNLFAPVFSPSPGVPAKGAGKLLRLDPAGVDLTVTIRRSVPFEVEGSSVRIYLQKPISGLSAPIASGSLVGMGHSPVKTIGLIPKKVRLVSTVHGTDEAGDDNSGAGYSSSPDFKIQVWISDDQAGPFYYVGDIPGDIVPPPPGDGSDSSVNLEYTLPVANYVQFRPVLGASDGGDTLLSLQMFVSYS